MQVNYNFSNLFILYCCCFLFFAASNEIEAQQKKTIDGQVHFYGDRYILKETEVNGKWFVLLENSTLEKLVKKWKHLAIYRVKGSIYQFNRSQYLLPTSFHVKPGSKVASKKSKSKKTKKAKKKAKRKAKKKAKKKPRKSKKAKKKSKKKTKKKPQKSKKKKSKKKSKKSRKSKKKEN